jgi:hypothetical protein
VVIVVRWWAWDGLEGKVVPWAMTTLCFPFGAGRYQARPEAEVEVQVAGMAP